MKNRIALVTGGMGGIGEAICRYLADQGAKVITTYNQGGNHAAAEKWQQEQKQNGYDFETCYVDVSNYDSCAEAIHQLINRWNRIDILVNNAGITRDVQFCKMSLEEWQVVLRTNLDGIFNMTRPVINSMIECNYGRIINISSVNGQKGQFGQANYSASKAGMHGLTKTLAQEVARKGITVNTISPGYVETKMVMKVAEPIREKIINQIPVGRLGKPEEIARAVGFLAAEASGFITGSNLLINGGQYLL